MTVHVWCPISSIVDAQVCGGTHDTEVPTRWKLWKDELSSSSSLYDPSGKVPPFSSIPFGSLRLMIWASLSPTCAVRTGRSNRGMQNCPGGSVCLMR